jgi:hypothetical protein
MPLRARRGARAKTIISALVVSPGDNRKPLVLRDHWGQSGAAEETRTPDPIITNDVLYQLSYSGTFWFGPVMALPGASQPRARGCRKFIRLRLGLCQSPALSVRGACFGLPTIRGSMSAPPGIGVATVGGDFQDRVSKPWHWPQTGVHCAWT